MFLYTVRTFKEVFLSNGDVHYALSTLSKKGTLDYVQLDLYTWDSAGRVFSNTALISAGME